tara:strand:+ start:108 stop:809 length:702 start_codon:yes stop_codon:yes gene_type:complete
MPCEPGKFYEDENGLWQYCPSEGLGEYGPEGTPVDYESSWVEQSSERGSTPLWDIMRDNTEFLRQFDINFLMSENRLPGMSPVDFTFEEGLYGTELGMLDIEQGIGERTAKEALKSGVMASGEQLASSGFQGGGAYERAGAKGRKKTFRDYAQVREDIALNRADARTTFEQEVAQDRYRYGDEVAEWITTFFGTDPTASEYMRDEPCPGIDDVWTGSECMPLEEFENEYIFGV